MSTPPHDPPVIEPKVLKKAYKQALVFAAVRLRKYGNSYMNAKLEPMDVANEAVAKVLNGDRPWDPQKTPDLFFHLAGCIKGIISNQYTSSDSKLVERSVEGLDLIDKQACHCDNQDLIELDSAVNFVIEYIAEARENLLQVTELMLREGVTEPKDLAVKLNITVKEVNTQKFALKRIMKRSNFILHYISRNRQDLIAIARTIYLDKVICDEEISKKLNIPMSSVRQQRQTLDEIVKGVRRGII